MEIIKEGKIKFHSYIGKPTKDLPVFYNPEMAKQRDITICSLSAFQKRVKRNLSVCDPLAGSGVRGIRILKEVKNVDEVVFNDVGSDSVKLIKKNLKLNKKKATVCNKDARILLLENRSAFDFIDIDPFGSPVKYLDIAPFAIKHGGLFASTATDMGALAGSFPSTCLRRYGIRVARTDFYLELGIRVLITTIQQAFSRHESGFMPLLSHSAHYFRVIGLVEKNRASADRIIKNIGFVSYCKRCLWKVFEIEKMCGNCKSKTDVIGPIWLGKIQDDDFVKSVLIEGEKRKFKIKISEEIDAPFYYEIGTVGKIYKKQFPAIEKILGNLKSSGFKASRSSLCPTGIKTDAGIKDFVKVFC